MPRLVTGSTAGALRMPALLWIWTGVLLLPSALTHFDGLPFSSLAEVCALALLAPVLLARSQRRLAARVWPHVPAWCRIGFGAVVFATLGLKLVLLQAPPAGFLACYSSTLTLPPAGRCERSFENPFVRFDATRIDRAMQFDPGTWDLSFFNSLRFNFYPWEAGVRVRDRLPFAVTWDGIADFGSGEVVVAYVGEGQLAVGSVHVDLPPAYDRIRTVRTTLPPGRHAMQVRYVFDDGSRTDDPEPHGPYATFSLTELTLDGGPAAPVAAVPPPGAFMAAALAVDILVVMTLLVLGGWILWQLRGERRSAAVIAAAAATVAVAAWAGAFSPARASPIVGGVVLGLVLRKRSSRRLLLAYVAVVLLGTWMIAATHPRLETVVYRLAGTDWLTYESFARTVLETWSLEGAEPVFYIQPLFRYLRFLERLLLGDGDPLPDLLAWVALHWSIIWAASVLRGARSPGRLREAVATIAGLLALALAGSAAVVILIQSAASEHPTWIFLALGCALLGRRRPGGWPAGAAFLATALITRPNQAPALAAILTASLWPRRRERPARALTSAAVFAAICLLPLAHNLFYGGRFVPFTTTATHPAALGVPLPRLLRTPVEPEARAAVVAQIKGLLYLEPPLYRFGDDSVRYVMHGLQILWLVAIWLAWRGPPGCARLLVLAPLLFLGVHVIYDMTVYYPRHILAGHFAMALATMHIAWQSAPPTKAVAAGRMSHKGSSGDCP